MSRSWTWHKFEVTFQFLENDSLTWGKTNPFLFQELGNYLLVWCLPQPSCLLSENSNLLEKGGRVPFETFSEQQLVPETFLTIWKDLLTSKKKGHKGVWMSSTQFCSTLNFASNKTLAPFEKFSTWRDSHKLHHILLVTRCRIPGQKNICVPPDVP